MTGRASIGRFQAGSEPAVCRPSRALDRRWAMTLGTNWAPRLLSVLRFVVGLVLLQYGTAKLFGWPDVEMFEDLKWLSLFGIAGMFELVGGTLLILGLFTRPTAFILSVE